MRRRLFIALVGGAMTAAPAARAQQKAMPVIGVLNSGSAGQNERTLVAFREGLAESGFVDGGNVAIEFRWADDRYDRLPALAADLVHRRVSVIAATNLPSALAARQATAAIPIVFRIGDDPVKHGLAASLSRPGGNATGVSMLAADLNEKRLGLLRELVPNASMVALLVNPGNPNSETQLAEVAEAGRSVGQRIEVFRAGTKPEIEAAFTLIAERRASGLIVGADPYLNSRRAQLVALAAHTRFRPSMSGARSPNWAA
jgi:putative tryptophan/tyrosine transport system substrate-binding protein